MDNPKIDISNSTSVALEIFDVYNATGNKQDPFTYTSLGKIAPGQTGQIQTIHAASQLQAMVSGTIPGLTNRQSSFPVKVLAVSILSDTTSFTVAQADVEAMVETYNFIRYVNANPGSKIGKQFTAVLAEKDQQTQVDAFFAASASFKHCTISTWSTQTFWQQQFLSPWQSSFYLYESGQDIKEIKLVAGVNIIVSADGTTTANLVLADASGELSKQSQVIDLAMNGGTITEKDQGSAGISVSLTPLWSNAQQKQGDNLTNIIAPVLTGVVNNTQVMGNFIKLDTSSGSDASKASGVKSWIDKQLQSINIQTVVGLLISFAMLRVMMRGEKNAEVNKSKDPVKEKASIESQQEMVEKNTENEIASKQAELSSKIDSLVEQINQQSEQIRTLEQQQKAQELLDSQKADVMEILESAPPDPQVETIVSNLQQSQENIDTGKPDVAITTLAENGNVVQQLVEQNREEFSQQQEDTAKKVQQDAAEAEKLRQQEQEAEKQRQQDNDKGSEDPVENEPDAETETGEIGVRAEAGGL